METKKYLKTWQYFSFGAGNAGLGLINNFVVSFIILYITNCYLNLNVAIIGTLMLVVRVFDGVIDIIFGSIMDRCHSKLGKAKPWLLRGAIPYGIFGIMLFFIPSTGGFISYAYFFIFYLLSNGVCYSIVNLSYSAMVALITKNDTERVNINMISFALVMVANMGLNGGTLGIIHALGNTAEAWRITMIGFTILGMVCILISGAFVKEVPLKQELDDNGELKKTEALPVRTTIKLALKNPFVKKVFGLYVVNSLFLAVSTSLLLYYCNINLKNINLFSSLSILSLLASMPGLFIAPILVKKLGTYKCNLVLGIITMIMTIICIPIGIMQNPIVFGIIFCLRFVPYGGLCASTAPIAPNVVQYSYKQTGEHLEGIIFASVSLGYKIASGISAALPGWLLACIGYSATKTVQSSNTVSGMAICFYAVPLIAIVLLVIFFSKMNVEKALEEVESNS
jgi:GPH family glycoside/pentoside/hexuronide:cation symporter